MFYYGTGLYTSESGKFHAETHAADASGEVEQEIHDVVPISRKAAGKPVDDDRLEYGKYLNQKTERELAMGLVGDYPARFGTKDNLAGIFGTSMTKIKHVQQGTAAASGSETAQKPGSSPK